ncbi:MAG TPA: bis-aminopropyl spermidine synthase family protein [Actinomycetota bacterium]|nr:bis-aminopropyl spermidine synthase family protein [Actinomycetota bacterium]
MTEAGDPFEEARAALGRLAADLGVDFVVARRLIDTLVADDSGIQTVNALVEATGIPHRRVLELLRALGIEAVKGLVEVSLTRRRSLRVALMNVVAQHPRTSPDLLSAIVPLAAGLPPPAGNLDHVPAVPATIVRRAEFLRATYELEGAHVVCLGDHDLTSVATALVAPGATVSVVDIDERVLRYLGAASDRLDLGLRLYAGDLRLGLPRTLGGVADLVFTDPPYSEEGIALFVDRAVEALADRPGTRILFCFGASDRGAEQVLAIQELLQRRQLVLELMAPGFNRYHGAHAIGATSALWVCRPTRRTRPAVAKQLAGRRAEGRIYSRGGASRESGGASLDPSILARVAAQVLGEGPVLVVGEGWEGFEPGPPLIPQRLADLLAAATEPPHSGSPRPAGTTVVVNLHPFYGDSLVRVLLAAPSAQRLVVVTPRRSLAALNDERRRLVATRWALGAAGDGDPAMLVAEPAGTPADPEPAGRPTGPDAAGTEAEPPASPADFLLRYLVEHQPALVRNAWREGLIQLASRQALLLTKNQARALIEETSMRPAELDAHLIELPADRLAHLVGEVEATVERLTRLLRPEG